MHTRWLTGLPPSYLLTVSGGRLGTVAGTLVIPKGIVRMNVGLKANLPAAEVKGASLVLAPGTVQQEKNDVFFLDRWHLVTFQASSESLAEGSQMTLKWTAAAANPAGGAGTVIRLQVSGTSDLDSDVTISGASATGEDEPGVRYLEVAIPAQANPVGTARSATVTIKAVADGKIEKIPERLVIRYDPNQLSSALSAAQLIKPYAPVQIRDSTATPLPPMDSDGDLLPDTFELDHALDPLTPSECLLDEDRDGILDRVELTDGTAYTDADSDNDGVNDFIEQILGSDPLKADAALAANIRDYVPIRLRTSGVLREKDDACFRCHAPGMTLAGIPQFDTGMLEPHSLVTLTRNLLLPPGSNLEVKLTLPPNYLPNPTQSKTYSAEILPLDPTGPSGFVVVEGDATKPLLATGLPIASDTFTTRKATLRVLKNPVLAVDANRDGVVRFDASDATSAERPYRFWVNSNDQSSSPLAEPTPDHQDATIQNINDLEDFSRLWADLPGLQAFIATPGIEVAFEWRKVTAGNPSIQIYSSAQSDGGLGYLRDVSIARLQVRQTALQPAVTIAIPQIGSTKRAIIPGQRYRINPLTWPSVSNHRFLLFEAASAGTGELVLLLLKNGQILVESEPVHLELLDIKEMYERFEVAFDRELKKPYQIWSQQPDLISGHCRVLPPVTPYRPDPQATPTSTTFVHGWNMKPEESIEFAETMFKRLWHAGYRGHFSSFRWPTDALIKPEILDKDVFDSFNFSEHRAFLSGSGLKQCIESLPATFRKNVVCHSMGGIVLNSAVVKGLSLRSAIYFQAAVSAGMFDTRTAINDPVLIKAENAAAGHLKTPDLFSGEKGYRGYVQSFSGKLINYYNAADFALQSGSYIGKLVDVNWIGNQSKSKPHFPLFNSSHGYAWFSNFIENRSTSEGLLGYRDDISKGFRTTRAVQSDDEMLAFIARSRTRALGAEPNIRGLFDVFDIHNLQFMGLTDSRQDHSGQFNRPIQEVMPIFDKTILDLQ